MTETYGQMLTRRRKALGLTQIQFAEKAGIGSSSLSAYEVDSRLPTRHQRALIDQALARLEDAAGLTPVLAPDQALEQIAALGAEVAAVAADPIRAHLFWAEVLEYAGLEAARIKKKYGGAA